MLENMAVLMVDGASEVAFCLAGVRKCWQGVQERRNK